MNQIIIVKLYMVTENYKCFVINKTQAIISNLFFTNSNILLNNSNTSNLFSLNRPKNSLI